MVEAERPRDEGGSGSQTPRDGDRIELRLPRLGTYPHGTVH
jgi:hypothetical protein